jgi:hypothetical protein
MQYFLLTVSIQTWIEHFTTGIAAINDPSHNATNRQGIAQRQGAMCELIGIKPGDLLFFYIQGEKKIKALFEANSEPFYDKSNLTNLPNCIIDHRFALRMEFQHKINFPNEIEMDEIWQLKDKGLFWSLQQQRGDAVGRHACISLTKKDGDFLLKMFYEKNPLIQPITPIHIQQHINQSLNFDLTHYGDRLHYEKAFQGLLINDLKNGRHKNILGDYDYFVPFFPTSSQKEIDIMLIKHNSNGDVIWYSILELKASTFTTNELDKLMNYEGWAVNAIANGNVRMVHSIGIANKFNQDVVDYISTRLNYINKKVRLIKYSFNPINNSLSLQNAN